MIVTITGEKVDVTNDIARAIQEHELEFTPIAEQGLAMMNESRHKQSCYEFERGYLCALSCIVAGHGTDTAVREALQALGRINWSRIDDYDRAVLAGAIQEVEKRRKRHHTRVKPSCWR
jgi:hypothetical protein